MPPLEVEPQEVKRRLDSGEKLHLIDVREPHEFAQAKIDGATLIPMRSVPGELQDLEVRADAAALIVADGTSCRHQIKDGAQRGALHVARVLAMSLDNAQSNP